ncbi:phosphoribosyltransferase [Streptomyces sp. TP-A0356]|uniref:phosphoribosyltransferase n=1 Tax=Streptomyces sp. TP-A0356 TaxID=1359208 RepID=UPI001F34336F|nr:phosphoribosyltransferase family protein [Streptomyces sp. TP-A0356]
MSNRLFSDRAAGRVLAKLLERYRGDPDVIVLGLPRGGVPVAYEVATVLGAPLDVFPVRKLGVPGQEEVAMGAIADGGLVVFNEDVVRGLGILPGTLRSAVEREARQLLRQEQTYREGRPAPELEGRTVILVDDGLATGAGTRAATQALRRHRPARIVVAVPAAPSRPAASWPTWPTTWSAPPPRRRSSPSARPTGTSARSRTRRCGGCCAGWRAGPRSRPRRGRAWSLSSAPRRCLSRTACPATRHCSTWWATRTSC